MAAKHVVCINTGPDREQLIDAFKYAPHDRKFMAPFAGDVWEGDIAIGTINFAATIKGLAHEDNSGHSFIVTATTTAPTHNGRKVEFHYNTKTQEGYIEL